MSQGSIGEGRSLEIGGLIQQDTKGKVEHIRELHTNQQDKGVDYKRIIEPGFDYFEYISKIKDETKNE